MRCINQVTLLGHAGRDAELRHFGSGSRKAWVSMATSRSWKKGDDWESESTWHNIEAWGREADKLSNVRKGQPVMVSGRISVENWTDNNGVEKRTTKIVADTVCLVVDQRNIDTAPGASGPHGDQHGQRGSMPPPRNSQSIPDWDDDDIPF